MEGLESMGFEECTPVQELAMPVIWEGKDLIACAQTGTGKTAAYLLPVLNRITANPGQGINTLIIAPTRELVLLHRANAVMNRPTTADWEVTG